MDFNFSSLLAFTIAEKRFAVPLTLVDRVIRAVEVTSVPDSHAFVYGIIDFHGKVIPVINLRKRFGMVEKKIEPDDRFIITVVDDLTLALAVDGVDEVVKHDQKEISKIELELAGTKLKQPKNSGFDFARFLRNDNGILIIYNLKMLLSSDGNFEINDLLKKLGLDK